MNAPLKKRRPRHQDGWVVESGKDWLGHYYTWDAENKRHHKRAYLGKRAGKPKFKAEEELRAIIEKETRDVAPAAVDDSFEWFWTHRFVPMQTWEPRTAGSLASVFKHHVFPAIGRTPISKLDRYKIQMVIQDAARTSSKSVVHKVRCYLNACLEEAVEQELLGKNPMRKLPQPDVRPECRRFLSIAEIGALLDSMNARDRLICRIQLVCGLRPGELFGAKWDDFDAGAGRLRIDEAAVDGMMKATKTAGSRAFVWMPLDVVASLKAWRATQSGAFIFPSNTGGPILTQNFLRRHIYPAAILAGIMQPRPKELPKGTRWVDRSTSVNFQAFRRTCATWFQKHGTTKDIQSHLRHASPSTTMGVYVQEIPESVRVAVEALDKMLFEQKPASDGRAN